MRYVPNKPWDQIVKDLELYRVDDTITLETGITGLDLQALRRGVMKEPRTANQRWRLYQMWLEFFGNGERQ